MLKTVNGRAIEHYKNFRVRETGLAVPKAEPLYVPAISNGYAPDDFVIDANLVLYVPLYLLKGTKFKSVDRYARTATVTGALWRPNGRLFDGGDYIEIPAADTELNFTSGAFSVVAGVYITSLAANTAIFTRSEAATEGYLTQVNTDGVFALYTLQGAANQATKSDVGAVVINTWYTLGWSRDGAAVKTYKNGIDVTDVAGVHVNPDTCDQKAYIGHRIDQATYKFIGTMSFVAVYSRALAAQEHLHIHNVMAWLYQ